LDGSEGRCEVIGIAVIIGEYKAYSQTIGVYSALVMSERQPGVHVYVNVEARDFGSDEWRPLREMIHNRAALEIMEPIGVVRQRDQDQSARLGPIVVARNAARYWALRSDMSSLLFIDSDVEPEPDGLERLLAHNKPLVGGLVPGRGAHAMHRYVFGKQTQEGNLVACDYGTCGYMLVRRDLLEKVEFRWGPSRRRPDVMLSEDPAFAEDALMAGFGRFYVDLNATSRHHDNPGRPLFLGGVAQF